jgi:hypothetical protein
MVVLNAWRNKDDKPLNDFYLNFTKNFSSYLTENTFILHYKHQSVNAVQGNNRFYFQNDTRHSVAKCFLMAHTVTTLFQIITKHFD